MKNIEEMVSRRETILMRLLNSPIAFGLFTFLSIFLVGSLVGLVFGFLIVRNGCQPTGPGDPCDGPAMAAVSMWIVSFFGSGILGLIVGIFCALVLSRKVGRLPTITP